MPSVGAGQRFRKSSPCPVCCGYDEAPRGQGIRCHGYLSDDGQWAHCSRDEHASGLSLESQSQTYVHRLVGDCRCGVRHDTSTGHSNNSAGGRRIVATYRYIDEQDRFLYQVLRYEPKGFRHRRPDGQGGWIWDLKGAPRVLYRLPQLIEAVKAGRTIFLSEGEKDVDALIKLGLAATTNSGGAKKFPADQAPFLRGAEVVILEDNDEQGCQHTEDLYRKLSPVVKSFKRLAFSDLPKGGDISDWLTLGHTTDELLAMVAEAPAYEPSNSQDGDGEATTPAWPVLDAAALHGLAGDIVATIAPHTEADPAALLAQTLLFFGNVVDRGPHCQIEADYHALNEAAVLVGATAKARKGTSEGQVRRLFKQVDRTWTDTRIEGGLSSGEGLIWAVRDAVERNGEIVEAGVMDKRLLVIEAEFASTLRVLGRDGNTLSAIIRHAWDGRRLSALTKNSPAHATDAHISIIGHITRDELLRYLGSTEAGNGFGNRFLWLCVWRSNILPEGGALKESALTRLVMQLRRAVKAAAHVHEIRRDNDAKRIWREVWQSISTAREARKAREGSGVGFAGRLYVREKGVVASETGGS